MAPNETDRLSALRHLAILDTPNETHFDAVCRLARDLFSVPIALVSLVEEDRQWFKAKCGTDLDGTERGIAFCNYTILSDDVLVVEDATRDSRFATNPMVQGEQAIRFYAGAPLILRPGIHVGALCIKDTVPRSFSPEQVRQLRDLAEIVVAHLRLHAAKRAQEAERIALQTARDTQRVAETTASFGHWRIEVADRTITWSDGLASIFGRPLPERGRIDLDTHMLVYHPDQRELIRHSIEEMIAGTRIEACNGFQGRRRVIRPNGEERVVTVRSVPVRDHTGRATSIYGVLLDVTEQAVAEERLHETGELLRATLETMDQGLIYYGPDQRVRVHNRRAREIIDLPPHVLHDGACMADVHRFLIERGEFAENADPLGRMVQSGEQISAPAVFERVRPNGTTLEVRGAPMTDGGVVWTFADITRRHEAERAVRASEVSYRLLADNTSDMIIRRSAANVRTYVSPSSQELLGFTPEEMMTIPLSATIHPDDAAAAVSMISDVLTGRSEQAHVIHRIQHKDGRWIWVDARSRLVRDEGGAPVEVITTVRDIGERKAAEDALRASEARYRLLAEHASDMVIRRSVANVRTYVSPSALELIGFTADELMTMPMSASVHPEDFKAVDSLMSDLFAGRIDHGRLSDRIQHKDGHWVWVESLFRLVRDRSGAPVEVITTVRDISERKGAEDALRESEARYRALADALPQIVWVMDARDGEATYVNRQFDAYYGSIGASPAARIARNHPDDAEQMDTAWRACREGRCIEIEVRLLRHDGEYRWHKLQMVPVARDGEIIEWLGTALDIHEIVEARAELERTANLLSLAQDAAGAGVWEWDIGGAVRLSPASARLLGHGDVDASVEMSLDAWKAHVCPEDRRGLWADVKRAMTTRTPYTSEFRVGGREGYRSPRWLQTFGRVVFDQRSGEPVRFVGLYLDVTTRRKAEEAFRASEAHLRVSEERLALALDSGEDCLFDWNLVTGALWVTERWRDKLGLVGDLAQPSTAAWIAAIHPDDRGNVTAATSDHLRGQTPALECEYRVCRADGSAFWVLARARVASRTPEGQALRLVGTLIDISQRKAAEARIAHMALHDALTGLPNRNLFRERLGRTQRRALLAPEHHAVLALDLDRFKAVNDTYGHVAGDRVLCLAAERLRTAVGEHDTVARLGGDEFAVILTDIDGAAETGRICERIIAAVDEPLLLDGRVIDIGISIGVALLSDDGTTAEDVFKRADMALYEAKAAGRGTYRLFDAEAHARTVTRSLLATDMKEAIRRGDFFLVYQPIIDVTRGAVASFEALMRWRHPVHGLISPSEFIPVAEETGLIVPLGAWALKEACREALNWPASVCVSVNVSAVQFRGGLEEAVIAALASSRLPATRLKLEVTESLLVHDPEQAVAALHRLRGLGVRIALDDFGTGYSSLSYLRRFPFHLLKIDRSFVRDIADPDAAAIVRAIVGIGERLGMGIVVEGVETPEQLELVRREGCTQVQGYLFSRPLPAVEARAFAEAHDAQAA